jgi:cation diffusion facilitator family transporter
MSCPFFLKGTLMHTESLDHWTHEHTFGQDRVRRGERRTLIVTGLTAVTMVVEIMAGMAFGSMALLADGLHMASHATALGIAVFAYAFTRRFAADPRYSFGTGKVNALAGFTSAVLLALFAAWMAVESVERFIDPVAIAFNQAIFVAVIGLLVNGLSVLILAIPHDHHHHDHGHDHAHHHHHHGGSDHNLHGAYLHVLADSLTSVLAIAALLTGKYFGAVWMDPAMGIVGAVMIARWSWGLLCSTSHVLLDRQVPETVRNAVREAIEVHDGDRVADLHVWSIGPGIYAAAIALVSSDPKPPDTYKELIPKELSIVHATVEAHPCTVHAVS